MKRLEAELEVAEDQRRKAAQEVVKLQSQLSESQHAAMGHKEVLVSEVSTVQSFRATCEELRTFMCGRVK